LGRVGRGLSWPFLLLGCRKRWAARRQLGTHAETAALRRAGLLGVCPSLRMARSDDAAVSKRWWREGLLFLPLCGRIPACHVHYDGVCCTCPGPCGQAVILLLLLAHSFTLKSLSRLLSLLQAVLNLRLAAGRSAAITAWRPPWSACCQQCCTSASALGGPPPSLRGALLGTQLVLGLGLVARALQRLNLRVHRLQVKKRKGEHAAGSDRFRPSDSCGLEEMEAEQVRVESAACEGEPVAAPCRCSLCHHQAHSPACRAPVPPGPCPAAARPRTGGLPRTCSGGQACAPAAGEGGRAREGEGEPGVGRRAAGRGC